MISKISIGTAQFGLRYGISNKNDVLCQSQINEVLSYAYSNNVQLLDTASSYGNSEENLGKQSKIKEGAFKLVSKFNNLEKSVEQNLFDSFEKLNQSSLYGYLVHDFSLLKKKESLLDELQELKNKGLIEKIGVSVYHPYQAIELANKSPLIDIIQLPYSIFDQRFNPILKQLKALDIEIHARSIFLQGLMFMDKDNLSEFFLPAFQKLTALNELSLQTGVPIYSLAINFVLSNKFIDHLIIGISSVDDIKKNFSAQYNPLVNELILDQLYNLSISDDKIILPYKWK